MTYLGNMKWNWIAYIQVTEKIKVSMLHLAFKKEMFTNEMHGRIKKRSKSCYSLKIAYILNIVGVDSQY